MIARMVKAVGVGALGLAMAMPALAQQAAGGAMSPPAPLGPNSGETAPAFTAPGASKDGVMQKPISLSDFKGKTVVLAFFPQARTRGCTIEMEHFRDNYAAMFNNGKDVVVLGISTDKPDTLAAWAKDAGFQFQFVSDEARAIGLAYGTLTEARKSENRYVYVIGPDGKIQYSKKPLTPTVPSHFDEIQTEVMKNAKK